MGRYATGTKVSDVQSQADIRRTLMRYGADAFGVYEKRGCASVGFEIKNLTVRIDVSLPSRDDEEFTKTETGRDRSESAAWAAHEQAVKQRWRALLLAIRAKLEAVEVGISTIEQEFMPFVVMPDGKTLGDHLIPRLAEITTVGQLRKLLPAPPQKGTG